MDDANATRQFRILLEQQIERNEIILDSNNSNDTSTVAYVRTYSFSLFSRVTKSDLLGSPYLSVGYIFFQPRDAMVLSSFVVQSFSI